MRQMEVPEVILSTFFLPELRNDPSYEIVGGTTVGTEIDLDVAPSLLGVNTNNNNTRNRLIETHAAHTTVNHTASNLAACTRETRDAPFPCRTSVLPERCLNGDRKCSTAAHNGDAPFVELDFHATGQTNFYPHLLVFKIPPIEEYAKLLFHSLNNDVAENRGWKVTLYNSSHGLIDVPVQDYNIGSNVAEHSEGLTTVQHALFGAITSDATYASASRARFMRVTLLGDLRQIWLDSIQLYVRDVPEKLV